MYRQTNFLFERFYQCGRGARPAYARHVLNAEHVGTGFFQRLGHVDIVFEIIFRTIFVKQITCVTNRRFTQRAAFHHGVDGNTHIVDPV